MFTVSRLARSSMLVLLAATLATAAYARDGGGGGGGSGGHDGGHNGSNGPSGPSVQVHGSAVQSDARIVSGNGGPPLSKDPVAHGYGVPGKPAPVVRDHRGDTGGGIPNYPTCSNGCVGEGGVSSGNQPTPQPNSYKPRDGQVNDHRPGGPGSAGPSKQLRISGDDKVPVSASN
jgi:hypothetical protein